MNYFTICLLTACFFCSSAEAAMLSFENQPTVSYHLFEDFQTSSTAEGVTDKTSSRSTIDFTLSALSQDEATVTIDQFTFRAQSGKKSVAYPGTSKKVNALFSKLIGAKLHFRRNEEGKMVETTGLLEEIDNGRDDLEIFDFIDYDPVVSFPLFFQQLFHLAGETLASSGQYAVRVEDIAIDHLFYNDPLDVKDLQYTISQIDEDTVRASFYGHDKKEHEESWGEMQLTGNVSWNCQFPLLQQRSMTLRLDAVLYNQPFVDKVIRKGTRQEQWSSKINP